ncbi:MAG: hypothetical protein H7255_15485 [Ramlibacter sp.]|nr:hypothetical protein [Ramlibacter sp.]
MLALLIAGSLWWMGRQRATVKRSAERLDADVPIGLLCAIVIGVLLVIALADRATYSAYATTVAAVCFALAVVTTMRSVLAQHPRGRAFSRSSIAAGLLPPREHRLPLMLILGLPLLVWIAGMALGVGLAVFVWTLARSDHCGLRTWLVALASSAVYMLATWWFVDEVANLVLPRGLAWQLISSS